MSSFLIKASHNGQNISRILEPMRICKKCREID